MANSGLNTAANQFFIADASAPHLDGKDTTFGQLVEGHELVGKVRALLQGRRKIIRATTRTQNKGNHRSNTDKNSYLYHLSSSASNFPG